MTDGPVPCGPTASRWQRWGWPFVGTAALVIAVAACTDAARQSAPDGRGSDPPPVAVPSTPGSPVRSGEGAVAESPRSPSGSQLVADDRLGGDVTAFAVTQNAFGLPAPTLTTDQRRSFEVGDSFFTQPWVQAPSSTAARDGLGPFFNANSCAACHVRDGRGQPPSEDHDGPGLLFRVSIPGVAEDGGPLPHPELGAQVQDFALPDLPVEAMVIVSHELVTGAHPDGTAWELSAPTYTVVGADGAPIDDPDLLVSPRIAPQVIGMGLLEAIPADDIRAAADPGDADGDGISGRPNEVWSPSTGDVELGRFGWKANVATVADQVAGAFLGDIGITSRLAPDDATGVAAVDAATEFDGSDATGVELSDVRLEHVVLYSQALSVPAQRDIDDPQVARGADVFMGASCASCHTPVHRTGDADIGALVNQTIRPFTDLLLHDMGEGLADGRPDHAASGTEWRTPPLWGIGLVESINGHTRFLHDGRARSLEEAILWHGGEAAVSRDLFTNLPAGDRAALIAFLESL